MPATFPCPNPNCGQLLAAESIQGTGKLACPRCGTVLQFRTTSTPTPPIPVAQPVQPARKPPPVPVPTATPVPITPSRVPPPVPSVEDDEDEGERRRRSEPDPRLAFEEEPAPDDGGDALVRRRQRRPAGWSSWLWKGPLLLTALSTTVVLSYLYIRSVRQHASEDLYVQGLLNARYRLPDLPWGRTTDDVERARTARGRMAVNYVACRSQPSAAFALFNRDYENRLPSEGELIDTALQKLRAYFTGVEWERKEEATWAGRPALRIEFRALDGDKVLCHGEVWAIAHRGFAYWFFSWAPFESHAEVPESDWEAVRKRLVLGTLREGWTETPPVSETARVPGTNYELSYPTTPVPGTPSMWERRDEEGWDPAAALVLVAYEREGSRRLPPHPRYKYAGKMGECQVLRLPRAENLEAAAEAAKTYVLEQQKKEAPNALYQPPEPRKGRKDQADGPGKIGAFPGYLWRQELLLDAGGGKRFILLAIVPDNDGVLVLQFKCNLEKRDYWEAEFAPIWQSLRPAK